MKSTFFKHIATASVVIMTLLAASSCRKPANQPDSKNPAAEEPDYEELIVGSWKNVKTESYNADELLNVTEYGDEGGVWVFFDDHIMEINEVLAYDWSIDANDQSVLVLDGGSDPNVMTIVKLTHDEMVLAFPIINDLCSVYYFTKIEE